MNCHKGMCSCSCHDTALQKQMKVQAMVLNARQEFYLNQRLLKESAERLNRVADSIAKDHPGCASTLRALVAEVL